MSAFCSYFRFLVTKQEVTTDGLKKDVIFLVNVGGTGKK